MHPKNLGPAAALLILLAVGVIGSVSTAARPQDLYAASGRALSVPYELDLTEVERDDTRSYVTVAGFHERSAPGARWLMCRYAEIAQARGFSYWNAVYPAAGSELLVLGFSNDATASARQVFGSRYDIQRLLAEQMAPVDRFATLCGFRR